MHLTVVYDEVNVAGGVRDQRLAELKELFQADSGLVDLEMQFSARLTAETMEVDRIFPEPEMTGVSPTHRRPSGPRVLVRPDAGLVCERRPLRPLSWPVPGPAGTSPSSTP